MQGLTASRVFMKFTICKNTLLAGKNNIKSCKFYNIVKPLTI